MKKYYSKMNKRMFGALLLNLALVGALLFVFYPKNKEICQYFLPKYNLSSCQDVQLEEETWYRSDRQLFVGSYAENDEGVYYISIIANSKDELNFMGYYVYNKDVEKADAIIDAIDAIYDLYENGIEPESVNFLSYRGYIYDMDETERQYFIEAFEDSGYDKETIDNLCYKTFYPVSAMKALRENNFEIILVVSCVIFGIWTIIDYLSGHYKKQVKKTISVNHLDEDSVAYDLDSGVSLRVMQIGKKYALCTKGRPALFIFDQIIWAYPHTTTTRTYYNGIPSGTSKSYEIRIFTSDKKCNKVKVSSEQEENEILEYLQKAAPAAIYGYDDNLKRTAKSNFSSLVNMVNQRRMEFVPQQEISSSVPDVPAQDTHNMQDTQNEQAENWEDTLVDLNLHDMKYYETSQEVNPIKDKLSNITWDE